MVKSYLRHGPTQAFGLVCTPNANSIYDGSRAYVPALEDVLVWDVKRGTLHAMWHETGHRAEVTCLCRAPEGPSLAVGYADGSIRLWDSSSGTVSHVFNGHKKAVTALAFDSTCTRLASGSQDTDLILWDVIGERGICRLRGHRDQITQVLFVPASVDSASSSSSSPQSSYVISTSKDTYLKLWDLNLQHCVQTVVAHRSEVWSCDMDPSRSLILTGSNQGDIKAWVLDHAALAEGLKETREGQPTVFVHPAGELALSSKQRVSHIVFHPTQPFLAVQSNDKSVEVFRIRSEEEVKKKRARRQKRSKDKMQDKADDAATDGSSPSPAEIFKPHLVVRGKSKIRSCFFPPTAKLQIFFALTSNAIEVFNIPTASASDEPPEPTRALALDLPGHRTDIRSLALSYDDQILASASNGSLKLWNVRTTACIRTLDCGYAICSTFLPSDRQIVVGTKSGELLVYDIASSSLVATIEAHHGAIWGMHVRPDGQVLATCSADKSVKFWSIKNIGGSQGPSMELEHTSSLQMPDDVLAVRYSPNGKLIAVALLDATVKVFYQDSLKFFLSLYGHKLPVLSMDISDDSKLIVTCSADKNVKIWGLDFGDCHKSIFAHEDSIMQVAFEKKSHYFWTASKDRLVKYWDGDKFELIQSLEGHHGEVWALVVSHHSDFVITGSHDKSIRVWEKLDEPLFLEEERERELETLHDTAAVDALNQDMDNAADGIEATTVNKQTSETLVASERIMQALELADKDRDLMTSFEETKARLPESERSKLPFPTRDAVLMSLDISADAYVLKEIEAVSSSALMDAILVLPFDKVVSLIHYLQLWAESDKNVTLVSRLMFVLLKVHHRQIVANRVLRQTLFGLRNGLRRSLLRQKSAIGYNLAALNHLRRTNEAQRTAEFFEEELDEDKIRAKIAEGRKRKRVSAI